MKVDSIKDDRFGANRIGYIDYADKLSALMVFKVQHPFVIGLFA